MALNQHVHFLYSAIFTGYFVVGGIDVRTANLQTSDGNVKFRRKFSTQKGQPILSSFLNNGNNGLNAIVLVYNKNGKPLQDLTLDEKRPFLKLNDHLISIIQENLVDMIVYARRASFDKCTIYERLVTQLAGRQYALREYDLKQDASSDFSLNRCTLSTEKIMPEAFKLGKTTPGLENDCAGIHFIMEQYAPELFNTIPQVIRS